MQHAGFQHEITVPVRPGEITLNDLFHVREVYQSFHVLGDEQFGFRDLYHLLHPHVQLAARLLGGDLPVNNLSLVILVRVKTVAFTGHAEILTRETTRYDIYFSRENTFPGFMAFH